MRQIITIVLLFTISVSSSGFTLIKHFCGDSLEQVQLNREAKGCCSDQEEMPDDCCHNEQDQALLDSFSQDVKFQLLPAFVLLANYILADYLSFLPIADTASSFTVFHSPPIPIPDLYLWVQSFLI